MTNLFKLEQRHQVQIQPLQGCRNLVFFGNTGNYLKCINGTDSLQIEAPAVVHLTSIGCNSKRNAYFVHEAGSFKDLCECKSTVIYKRIQADKFFGAAQVTSTLCPALFIAMAADSPAMPPPTIPISSGLCSAMIQIVIILRLVARQVQLKLRCSDCEVASFPIAFVGTLFFSL